MKKYFLYIVITLLTCAFILSVQQCSHHKNVGMVNTETLTDTIRLYKNKVGTVTAEVKVLQLDKKQLKAVILDKDAELKKLSAEFSEVHTIIKYKTITKYDTITVAYTDTIPCDFEIAGNTKNKWYNFDYLSNQQEFKIENLTIPNEAIIITGNKRTWFLGKETVTTDITNSNPYLKVTEVKSAEVVIPTPIQKKWYVWLAIGAAGGLFLNK